MQTNPESVDRREKEGIDGPNFGENHQRPLGWEEGCHWDGGGEWGIYMKAKRITEGNSQKEEAEMESGGEQYWVSQRGLGSQNSEERGGGRGKSWKCGH